MKRILFTFFFLFSVVHLYAEDYYWVGGGGYWSDLNTHWRLGSPTGSIPSIVPAAGDNVFFGSYSGFTPSNRTVILNTNAFCNNMEWGSDISNNPVLSREGTATLFVYGSLVLQPTMGYANAVGIEFTGSSPATLTTNGDVTGILNLNVNKAGSGLTLTDDLVYAGSTNNNSYGLTLTAGYLDASGKELLVYSFLSQTNNARHLDITNARVHVLRNFYYTGTGKTLAAEGSSVHTDIRLAVDGGAYNEVDVSSSNPNNDLLSINNTTFSKLIFSNTSLANNNSRIHAGNAIDSLIFMGPGVVRLSDNTIGYLSVAGDFEMGGGNNVVDYAEIGGALNIFDNGGHVFDTLLTAPNKNITIARDITINKLFRAGGEPCDGFTEITGSSNGTIHFADGAEAEIDNVLLTTIAATGSITPLTVSGIDNEGNSGFIINTPSTINRTLYWVGGAGDWSDRNHWSEVSGGAGGACIPFIGDDVIFDGNSGLNGGGTVTTVGNTYCHNMTWAADITGSPVFATNSTYYMRVYGSVVLNPNVTMNTMLDMRGTEAVTFTTNGSIKGNNRILVRKESVNAHDSGVTLSDDWLNPTGSFQLNRGYLDVSDRTVNINIFLSNVSSGRYLNMEGANITVNHWEYRGNYKTLDADNSLLTTNGGLLTVGDMLEYNEVEMTTGSQNPNYFSIAQTTFRKLTFSNPSLTTASRIGAGNVIERLEFKGQGTIAGTGNVIDSLITAESRNFWLWQGNSNTVNKYFKATHPDCSGLGEIRTGNTGTSELIFGPNAEVEISNVYMENIVASGGGGTLTLPITFSGADAGGNSGWNIIASDGDARYWVGGAGDWNDAAHWSTISGGPGGACIPTVTNDVYFDENSGFGTTTATRIVTVNNGNAYFRNMSWEGAPNAPILNRNAAWNMEAWGESIVLNPSVTLNATFQLKGPASTVMTGQTLGNFHLHVQKPGASFTIANDYTNTQTQIMLYDGDFVASDIVLSVSRIDNENRDNNISVDISGSTVNLSALWRYSGTTSNRSLDASDAIINTQQFIAQGFVYDRVNVSGTGQDYARFNEITANYITFTQTNVTAGIGINGTNNQLDTVEFKGGGAIYGTGNTIGTLIFFPGSRYILTAGTNTTITNDWFGSGTPCQLTEIVSSSGSAVATVTKSAGSVDFDYVRLQRIAATGGAAFGAGAHSLDLGGSTGWNISPYDGASPIEGLGPDIRLADAEFPYTVSSAGFFGSPLSQYEWQKDGIVVGNSDELIVTEPGEYSIKVDFPDGCMVLDTLLIARDSANVVTEKSLKDTEQTSYVPGEDVIYTITVTNEGPDDAVNVQVADEAPEDTEIAAWTATVMEGPVDLPNASGSGNLAETIALLPNGAVVEYEITLSTASSRLADLSNTVEVSASTPDPESDCAACTTSPIPAAPLAGVSVTKELADDTQQGFVPGEDVIYTVVVANDGPSDAREVLVTDNAPDGTIIGSWTVTVTQGEVTLPNTSGTGNLAETIAVLPSGAAVTYEVAVQTPANFAESLANTASVAANTDDPDETDNSVTTDDLRAVPEAPVGENQEECAESPVQTLTAEATVPSGITIVWYNAATDGDEVADPILDEVGTVTYYAEARNGALPSATRTAVTLTINDSPVISVTDPAVACVGSVIDLTAPEITVGSDAGLTYTYYTDAAGTEELTNPNAVVASGIYYITGTNPETGCSVTMPVSVQFVDRPVVTVTHPDCVVGTGSIAITQPLGTGFEYSIDGTTYQAEPLFEDVAPGTYQATARHVSIPACVSAEREVVINATPTTYTPTIVQPDCDNPLGQLIFPDNPDYEYAVYPVGGTPSYQSSHIFSDVAPGDYLVQMRSLLVSCEADPVAVTVDEAPVVPVAPVSGGDVAECAATPLQTLTATATVPTGVTIIWYDAPAGGNVVANPTLNAVGTVTYYAEATNGTCVSTSRTAVILTISAQPVIDPMDPQVVCGSFMLPDITGTDLPADRAYYTAAGGGGTRYEIGDVISAAGTYVLYQYAATVEGCVAESPFALTINETPIAGTIGADQSICYEETPEALSSVAEGTGTGTISYRWESSSDGASWLPVAGASDATYQPDALTGTMHYRRVTVATGNGLTCESEPTEPVTVAVTGELTANAGADQTKYNDSVFMLDAEVPTLGSGSWSVVSTEQPAALADATDPAATVTLLPNTSVTLRWTVTEGDCSVFDEVSLTSVNGADVAVTKTLKNTDQSGYVPGSTVAYVITVRNNGPAYAEGVRIQDVLPAGATLVGWTAQVTEGEVFLPGTSGSDALDETILILPNGAAVTYEVTLLPSAETTDDLINTVEISSDTDDADLSNNTVVTTGLPSVPEAPVSDGDQEACVESPLQTQTATATVPDGQTVVWYDAPTGGNSVATPTLNEIGTVIYYAEAVKGMLVSETRTPVTLTIHALPVVTVTDPAVACAGSVIDLTAAAVTAGSGAGLVYTYYTDAAGTAELPGPDAVAASGTYYIRGTDPGTGCSTIAPVAVQFVDRPEVTVMQPDCATGATGSLRITAPLGADFEYAVYEMGSTPVYSDETEYAGLIRGATYQVVARNVAAGCESEVQELTIRAMLETYPPTVSHPGCGETTGTIEFPADGDYEYAVYQTGETPVYQSSPVFAELAPGEYLAQMRSTAMGCEGSPVTVTIHVAPEATAAPVADDQTACADDPALPLRAVATVSDGLSVVWYDSPTGGQVVTDPTLDAVGTATYYAEATDGTCVSTMRTAVTLTVRPKPAIDPLDDVEICDSYTLPDITGTELTGDKAYFTEPGGAGHRYEIGDVITQAGTYQLYRYAAAGNGCDAEAGFILVVRETPVADAGEDQSQANNPVFTLDGNVPDDGAGTWQVVSGTPSEAISDIHDPRASVSVAPGTSLTLRWTVSNGICEASDEVVLTQLAVPKADLRVIKTVDNATPLVTSTVVFTVEVTNEGPDNATGVTVVDELPSGYTFVSAEASAGAYNEGSGTWTVGRLVNGASATLQITAAVNAEGAFLNRARAQGNEEDSDAGNNVAEVSVIPVQPPRAEDDSPTGGLSNKVLVISVLANDVAQTHAIDAASVEIVGQPQHGTVSMGTNGTIAYTSDRGYVGTDQLTYRVRDTEGNWSNVATVTIVVAANPLRVPNIFTPNGDGQNDRFEIEGIEGFDRAELVVFNRWGNEIYRQNDYDNSWGGAGIHEGTYYYVLTLHKGNDRQVEKGWVVLKKQ